MKPMKKLTILIATLFAIPALSQVALSAKTHDGGTAYYTRKAEGWFFYKDPTEKKEKVEEVPPPAPPVKAPDATPAEPKAPPLFSVDWIAKNLEELRKKAIDDPTPENLRAHMYAQRVMLDKAQNFADKTIRVVREDPFLDENNRIAIGTAMRARALQRQDTAIQAALKDIGKKAGLYFFFKTSCQPYCNDQYLIVNRLAKRHNMTLFNVSLDGSSYKEMAGQVVKVDAGQFKQMELRFVPATVLVIPPNKVVVLAQGATALDELESRIVAAAQDHQLLSKEQLAEVNIYTKGILSSDEMSPATIAAIDPKNPTEWVNYLRRTINRKPD